MYKAGGTNILLVRPAYSYRIVLMVFVLKALINLYVGQNVSQAMAWLAWVVPPAMM